MALGVIPGAMAQVEREFFARTPPYPVYQNPDSARYNLKLGKLTARLTGNVQAEFNDNINLSESKPEADFSIGPYVAAGFLWPVNRFNVLNLDIGLGYRWYMKNPDANALSIAPNTHLDYTIYIKGVRVTVSDRLSISVDPITQTQVTAVSGNVTHLRRLTNTASVSADWQATRDLDVYGGYAFSIDRSLTSSFTELDRDDNTFYGGVNYAVNSLMKAGFMGSYSMFHYLQPFQNDGESLTVGPTVNAKLTKFLTLSGSVGYTMGWYSHTGSIADTSDYSGVTYSVGLEHIINRHTSQNLRFSQSLSQGFGSNYSTVWTLQYGINTHLTRNLSLNGIAAFENIEASGANGEAAQRYLLYVGSGYQLSRNWSVGLSYSLAVRDSDQALRGYVQNRVTVDATYRF